MGGSSSAFNCRVAIEEGVERDPGFDARQRSAKAVVNARAEPDVAAEVAVQSELVWVGEFLRITIRGVIAHPDQRSRRNFYARDFDVAGRLAIKLLHRTLIAQSLFDHRLDQAAIIP